MKIPHIKTSILYVILLTTLLSLVGCNLPAGNAPGANSPHFSTSPELKQTSITFKVHLLQPLPGGDSLYISILDEVTGLALNPHKYILQAEDSTTYSLSLPFYLGAVIKYRYSREGASVVDEHLTNERPVRYRLYHVEGPATVDDIVSRWTDTQYQGLVGRIMGIVQDISTGKPVPNILVSAGGEQALTLMDGSFLLEGLPPGAYNLVLYSLDGSYQIFQQGAVVASDSTTPVAAVLSPSKLVTVIFTVKVPADTPEEATIRLAGNLYQLGNTFADLPGGVSTLASRMPVMGKLPDGRFILTLSLPAGTYLEYKYTLGDGLWSSELTKEGELTLRQLLIPNSDLEQNDVVNTWHPKNTQPIQFHLTVPAGLPAGDSVFIQFNPGFGWMEPLPMQAEAGNAWNFNLTGPYHLSALHYRYCRQAQCGSADDTATLGKDPSGRILENNSASTIIDEILSWAWLADPGEPASVPDIQVQPRGPDFMAGIAFQPVYQPSWLSLLPGSIHQATSLAVNWLVLSPTWSFTNNTPPILETLPAQDMLQPDLVNTISSAEQQGFKVGIFPQPHFPGEVETWWKNASRDFPWWVSFFERYSNFILHHASLANDTHASSLILGGDWLDPALPGGTLADGSASNVPQDAEGRWRELIRLVRERYTGTVAWALTYPDGVQHPPPFLDAVDQIYILWSAPLETEPAASFEDLVARANTILENDILPFQQILGKPVIIAISYPSITNAAMGCINLASGGCLNYDLLAPPNPDIPSLELNLQDQATTYNAVLTAINDQIWVAGFFSMGYYPPTQLQDKSLSINGKPAAGVVWFWSKAFLGK